MVRLAHSADLRSRLRHVSSVMYTCYVHVLAEVGFYVQFLVSSKIRYEYFDLHSLTKLSPTKFY